MLVRFCLRFPPRVDAPFFSEKNIDLRPAQGRFRTSFGHSAIIGLLVRRLRVWLRVPDLNTPAGEWRISGSLRRDI
jgi:hypothetical protein